MQVYGFVPLPDNKIVIVAETPKLEGDSGEIKLMVLSEAELEEKLQQARSGVIAECSQPWCGGESDINQTSQQLNPYPCPTKFDPQ